ncbi:MAG: methionyl-tRNA formyltransferase [Alphaproteobacteria bacterium]
MRLAFMGTPEFALPALDAVREAGHHVVAVYSQPARPAGRGKHLMESPVARHAAELGLPVHTPATLHDAVAQQAFAALQADAAVVVAYGLLLPPPMLQAPHFGCLNIHGSLLPRWRGAAPIERAILAGDRQSGVTIMQMDEGLDTGPILLQSPVEIGPQMTGGELRQTLARVGAWLVCRALEGLATGSCVPRPQPEEGGLPAPKIRRRDRALDWRQPAATLARVVRAFAPTPGAWCVLPEGTDERGERQLKVLQARVVGGIATGRHMPGTVLDDRLTIACGEGALGLDVVQRGGRASMAAAAFLRGYDLPAGARLPPPVEGAGA